MKSYEEIANSVFKRRDEFFAEKKRKRAAAIKWTSAAVSFCLVAMIGIGIWQSDSLRSAAPTPDDDRFILTEAPTTETAPTEAASAATSEPTYEIIQTTTADKGEGITTTSQTTAQIQTSESEDAQSTLQTTVTTAVTVSSTEQEGSADTTTQPVNIITTVASVTSVTTTSDPESSGATTTTEPQPGYSDTTTRPTSTTTARPTTTTVRPISTTTSTTARTTSITTRPQITTTNYPAYSTTSAPPQTTTTNDAMLQPTPSYTATTTTRTTSITSRPTSTTTTSAGPPGYTTTTVPPTASGSDWNEKEIYEQFPLYEASDGTIYTVSAETVDAENTGALLEFTELEGYDEASGITYYVDAEIYLIDGMPPELAVAVRYDGDDRFCIAYSDAAAAMNLRKQY